MTVVVYFTRKVTRRFWARAISLSRVLAGSVFSRPLTVMRSGAMPAASMSA